MPVARALIPALMTLLALGGGSGCSKHLLEGSLTELLDLDYKDATILITDTETSVRFSNPRGTGEDTVFEVSAKTADLAIVAHGDIDLTEQLESGGQRGAVSRNVLNDPHTTFPPFQKGNLRYEVVPVPGATVPGTFSITFKECIDFGCGRTVFGDFTAKVPKP